MSTKPKVQTQKKVSKRLGMSLDTSLRNDLKAIPTVEKKLNLSMDSKLIGGSKYPKVFQTSS